MPAGTPDGHARLLLRPDGLTVDAEGSIAGTVRSATFRGSRIVGTVALGATQLEVHLSPTAELPPVGAPVRLAVDPQAVLVLSADGRSSL